MRVAIYARASEDRSGDELSVDRQLEGSEARAVERWGDGVTITRYVDNDKSATTGKPRPDFERLLADVDAGHVDVIVTWSPDRFIRRPVEYERVIDLVERHHVQLVALQGQDVDLTTPYGRAVARIFGAIARQEVEQKAARQKAANLQRAQAGNVGWSRRPYGYDLNEAGEIVIVPTEADELRAMAGRVLAGDSLASIARDLNERGIGTTLAGKPLNQREPDGPKHSGEWTVTTLKRLLVSPRHAGRAVYNGQDLRAGAWEAIFDEETHDRLTRLLRDGNRRTTNTTNRKYLLSGIVRCGRCGEDATDPMFASPMGAKGKRWLVYKCHRAHLARRLDLVDQVVEAVIVARLSLPDAARVFTPDVDVAGLRAQADELRRRRDGLAELLAEGLLSREAVREQSRKLGGRLTEIEQQTDHATGTSPVTELIAAADVAAAWDHLPLMRRREVVTALCTVTILPAGKGARFDPEQVRIEWRTS